MIDDIYSLTLNEWTLVIATATLVVAVLGFVIAALTYHLKGGIHVRGSYGVASSNRSTNCWITDIELENMKDRSITVYSVYVRFGHNVYLELANFEHQPLTIKPFELYKQTFKSPNAYTVNLRHLNLNELIFPKKVKKHRNGKIFISTPDGRVLVKPRKTFWNPIIGSLKNPFVGVISPSYADIDGKYFENNCRFVAELKTINSPSEYFGIYPGDENLMSYKNIRFTKEDLEDAESIKASLISAKNQGTLNFDGIVVHDYQEILRKKIQEYSSEPIQASAHGWFLTHVIGTIAEFFFKRKIKLKNRSKNAR